MQENRYEDQVVMKTEPSEFTGQLREQKQQLQKINIIFWYNKNKFNNVQYNTKKVADNKVKLNKDTIEQILIK